MKFSISTIVLTSMLVCGYSFADTDTQSVQLFSGGNTDGTSFLTRLDDKVLLTVEVVGLLPGNAVTLWWVVFNNPDGCFVVESCGSDEDFTDEGIASAEIAVGNATGNVVKSDGTLEFGAVLREGADEPAGHQILFIGSDTGHFLEDAASAEIHIVVQTHGKARGGKKLREQLSNFEANCTPSCADVQFAVHKPPAP